MKKQFFLILLLALVTNSFSQQTRRSPALTKQDYLKKSKSQKTAAWILLGAGTILITTGVIVGLQDATEVLVSVIALDPKSPSNNDGIFTWTGLAAVAGSIPLFIAAHRNINKSISLSFRNEKALKIQKSSFIYTYVPSITLKISL